MSEKPVQPDRVMTLESGKQSRLAPRFYSREYFVERDIDILGVGMQCESLSEEDVRKLLRDGVFDLECSAGESFPMLSPNMVPSGNLDLAKTVELEPLRVISRKRIPAESILWMRLLLPVAHDGIAFHLFCQTADGESACDHGIFRVHCKLCGQAILFFAKDNLDAPRAGRCAMASHLVHVHGTKDLLGSNFVWGCRKCKIVRGFETEREADLARLDHLRICEPWFYEKIQEGKQEFEFGTAIFREDWNGKQITYPVIKEAYWNEICKGS